MVMIHGPAPGPPHHLILTREAAGCESRPEPDGLRSLAFATVGTALLPPRRPECRVPPPAAERAGSNAPLCEVGWPRTYFSHKDKGLARRPPAGRKRRRPDPSPGDPAVGLQRGVGSRSLGRKRVAGSLVALHCLGRSRVQGRGGGPDRGARAEGPLERREPRLLLGSLLHPWPCKPRPRDPGCSDNADHGQMPALPALAAGWGQRPDASPCLADKGGVAPL